MPSVGAGSSRDTLFTSLNPPDLAASYLALDRSVSNETSITLNGTVTNNGRETLANVPVTIHDESGSIFETTIASLAIGESATVDTTLATPAGNEYRFTLIVDPGDTLGEPDRSDNEFPIIVTLAQLQDGDNDGMANDWEELYFGTLDRDGDSDFDADGLSDRFEFLTQNNPADPSSTFPFTIESHPTEPDKVLISFPTIQGNIYRIQRTSDFTNWTNDSFHYGTGETISASADTQGDTGELNGFRILVGAQ